MFFYIFCMGTYLIFSMMFCAIDFVITNPPPIEIRAIELDTDLVVSEEIITGKNGGHNDGTIYQKYELNDDELKEVIASIESNFHWQKGALSDELKDELRHIDSIDSDNPMFNIDNGYYLFKDRHDMASGDIYKFNREIIISSRGSCNYIISALDVENKTLYYFQLDT